MTSDPNLHPTGHPDATRATARLPGLDIEVVHRLLEAANPMAFWMQAAKMMWAPWLGAANAALTSSMAGALPTPHAETPHAETPHTETARAETPRTEPPRADVPSSDVAPTETPRPDTVRAVAPSPEAPRTAAPAADAPSPARKPVSAPRRGRGRTRS